MLIMFSELPPRPTALALAPCEGKNAKRNEDEFCDCARVPLNHSVFRGSSCVSCAREEKLIRIQPLS